tara:strand:- start:215 stop:1075 length:861 start_codon:yes stop_codon:yes gene_type:complete
MKDIFYNYFILFFLAFIWGSSFILMKKGLVAFTDQQVAALRLFIAFLTLLPFLFKAIKDLRKTQIIPLLIIGLFGNGLPAFLFTKAQNTLDSSFVGILNSLTPIFTLLVGIGIFGKKISIQKFIGVLIGLFGVLFLYFSSMKINEINYAIFLVILATICYSISINVIKIYTTNLDAISIASIAFAFIGPFAGIYLFSTDFLEIIVSDIGMQSFFYVCILATVCTSFALVIFNGLIKKTSAIFASSVTYLIPLVALFWGLLDKETIKLFHLIGILIILQGVYLVTKE